MKECISDLWEVSKVKLYGVPGSSQPQSLSLDGTVVEGQRRSGKADNFSHSSRTERVTDKLSKQNVLVKMAPPRYLGV